MVRDRRGLRGREITFENPRAGRGCVALTNALTLAPGGRVLRYKTRWEIEKGSGETKTKLQEKKSRATARDGQGNAGALCGPRA